MSDELKLLTKDEARRFVRDAVLPEDFKERVRNALEFTSCTNCGGVKDMNVVLRDWWNEADSPCPFCTDVEPFDWELYP